MATAETSRKPYQEAARDLLRDSLLDAAGELMQDSPWSEISMAAIATRAGVSRQTLYNEFGSRDVFAQSFALREADRFLVTVEEAFAEHIDDPRRALFDGFVKFLEETEKNTMVRQIIVRDPGADELLSLFTSRGGPVVAMATQRLKDRILEMWPEADPDDARVAAEGFVRLGISHAGLPSSTPEESARLVVALTGPFIDEALGKAT